MCAQVYITALSKINVTKLNDNVEDAEKLRELVEEACDKQDEQLNAKNEQIEKLSEEIKNLQEKLVEQKNYSDQVFELNKQLKSPFQSSSLTEEVKQKIAKLEGDLKKAKEDLGKKNIEYAGLKVDVEKGELEYKKKCEVLQVRPAHKIYFLNLNILLKFVLDLFTIV